MHIRYLVLVCLALLGSPYAVADSAAEKFAQLGTLLDTPTASRLASGAPGPGYWQQRADYVIEISLDDERQRLEGNETITYYNNSPHPLSYLWVQLDQNRFQPDSMANRSTTAPDFQRFPYKAMARMLENEQFEGGYDIQAVTDGDGKERQYTINGTMMRIDLQTPLAPGGREEIGIRWAYQIPNADLLRARAGYEYFEADGNYIYEIAQWFPRMAAYTDYEGWQNKQFLGAGEFALELGDYTVRITVPADHIVAATGELQNPEDVLSNEQLERWQRAQEVSGELEFIVTPEEAKRRESSKTKVMRTWQFKASNVRDFAWASSRKFIWDARTAANGDDEVLAMSFYPNEAEPLWSQYSTAAVVHAIEHYNRYTFQYPYPVSISVNGPVGGMEYPMITFNKPRPYADKTYWDLHQKSGDKTWERSKYGLISVIIHEVGHNYFPMIVNSDERQWTWMDEGLNTYLQYLTEQAWEEDFPSRRGPPEKITAYMTSERQVPIMTNSESVLQLGNNAYGKPATALNILRETVMGRELFDFAFREYAKRWQFKRPTPADFFRTMEDASAVDLDWFWRGWFYTTDHVDIALDDISRYQISSRNPEVEKPIERAKSEAREKTRSDQRNADMERLIERHPELRDFYNDRDEFAVTPYEVSEYEKLLRGLADWERALLETERDFYALSFSNQGGLVMPIPLRVTYADDSVDEIMLPAEIWRKNAEQVTRIIMSSKEITAIEVDPYREIADADRGNNHWPRKVEPTRFELFKQKEKPNPMRQGEKEAWEQPIR
ncbi:MAG: M1 family metallopeptidase [Pseudomonadota bacterium]